MVRVALRALGRDDLPRLSDWLREPEVACWWHDDPDPAALERHYGPTVDGTDPTTVLIAELDERPVGLVQWFWWADEAVYRAELTPVTEIPDRAASLDYLIGAAADRGRGVGQSMIDTVLAQVWEHGASTVIVPVHADNVASRAVLERAGFTLTARAALAPDNPAHDTRHVVYRLDRPVGSHPAGTEES